MKIKVDVNFIGEFTAIDDDTYDGEGSKMGWGATPEEAIADLLEQMEEA